MRRVTTPRRRPAGSGNRGASRTAGGATAGARSRVVDPAAVLLMCAASCRTGRRSWALARGYDRAP